MDANVMMQAMPYNLQGIISQISCSNPKWKSIEEEEKKPLEKKTSSFDSEPTSTHSPSPPGSSSTLSSFFDGGSGGAGGGGEENNPVAGLVALSEGTQKEVCLQELQNLDNGFGDVSGGGGGMGLEEWESPGDGALLPWIMGETDDPGSSLKLLFRSANHVEFNGNSGIAVVDQRSGLVRNANSNFTGSMLNSANNGKIGSGLSNCSSGLVDCKVSSNGLSPNFNHQANSLGFSPSDSVPVHLQKPQINNTQLVQAQRVEKSSFLMPPLSHCQLDQHLFPPEPKRHNPGFVLDPGIVSVAKTVVLDPGHEVSIRKQLQLQVPMGLAKNPVQVAKNTVPDLGRELSVRKQQQKLQGSMGLAQRLVPQHVQQNLTMLPKQEVRDQALKDELFKAAELIQTGNFPLAQEILARLNHQFSLPPKPLVRATLYAKEALELLLKMNNPVDFSHSRTLTPFDIIQKLNAYKVFSDVSPGIQFVNFTRTQAILECLDGIDAIHVLDFDIGCGAHWVSLIQDLFLRKHGSPSFKVTAFASLSTTHPFELSLIRETLINFARDVGIGFDFQVVNFDSFDPSSTTMPKFHVSEHETVAVNMPIWAFSSNPSVLPSILHFVKKCSPRIMVSFDRGLDRFDVPFPLHVIHAIESCTNFSESLDGLNVGSDIVTKIEKFFVRPKMENAVLGRLHAPEKMPHWKNLFASAGFFPVQFSNFAEIQADYVVKRTPSRGFHLDKRQSSLVLSWQRRELVAASAWRC